MSILDIIAALAVAVSAPAAAQEAADKSKLERDMDKVVCKRVQVTGSRLSQARECFTKRDWRRMASSSEREHQEMTGAVLPPKAN